MKARIIALPESRASLGEAGRQGFRTNGALLGVYGFNADPGVHEGCLAQWLSAAFEGDLSMRHPASELLPGDAIAAARRHEFDVLSASAVERLLHEQHITIERPPRQRSNGTSPAGPARDAAQGAS